MYLEQNVTHVPGSYPTDAQQIIPADGLQPPLNYGVGTRWSKIPISDYAG